ncbi:3-ketodihydrosphingosine reductase-like [Dendronephthya gigantea]|uniref:3-ketodihydrosphingosine reductase-like n=1 Tax=Dendronephthya gigantea TaxID=151771 RepID=UPI00106D7BEF|nr:3-ketodihydrosphingosine reductase-like [Dendronephthya gigantea]
MFYFILLLILFAFICIPLIFWFPPCKKIPSLSKLHIVITGGSSGIGKSLAIEAVKRHANVSLLARNKTKLENAKKEVEKFRSFEEQEINIFCADVTDYSQLTEVLSQVKSVDILINCAGMAKTGLFEDNHSSFKQLMDLNYFGSVNATFSILPKMKTQRFGHVVFISSMAGQLGIFGYTGYSASKFALRGLAESLLMEVRPHGIGVSIAFPPDTDTPGFEEENKDKPEETQLISASAGVFSPSLVAKDILNGVQSGKFLIASGMDGHFLNMLTCGASPASSRLELIIQAFMMGIIRLVMTVYSFNHHKIAEHGEKKRRETISGEDKQKMS